MRELIQQHFNDALSVHSALLSHSETADGVALVAAKIVSAYRAGGKVLFAGNGGSAADAQHLAAELVGRFGFDRPALPAISLASDIAALTAISNDYGYASVFARQVEAYGAEGDVFIGISTSGNSHNICEALRECKRRGVFAAGLTGAGGGAMESLCDICIKAPSDDTPRIQEIHILLGHIICCIVEKELFGQNRS